MTGNTGASATFRRSRRAAEKLPAAPAELRPLAPLALIPGDHSPRVEVEVAGEDGRPELVNALASGEVEAAIIRTGETVERAGEIVPLVALVNRRRGSPLIDRLDRPRREAAGAYALAFEIVSAGGVSGGGGFVEERVGGGRGASEGRQLGALAWSDRLRVFEAAIGTGAIRLTVAGVTISTVTLIREVTVAGFPLHRVLATRGLKRSAPRENALKRAVVEALGRIAAVSGDAPCAERRKKPLTTEHGGTTSRTRSGSAPRAR